MQRESQQEALICKEHGQEKPCNKCTEIEKRLDRVESFFNEHVYRQGRLRFEELDMPLEALRNKKILEIGAGTGKLMRYLQREGVDVLGVDMKKPTKYEAFISVLNEYLFRKEQGILEDEETNDDLVEHEDIVFNQSTEKLFAPPNFLIGNYTQLPAPDHSIDIVIGTQLGPPARADQAIKELQRILAQGGEAHLHAALTLGQLNKLIAQKKGILGQSRWQEEIFDSERETALVNELDRISHILGKGWRAQARRIDTAYILDLYAPKK